MGPLRRSPGAQPGRPVDEESALSLGKNFRSGLRLGIGPSFNPMTCSAADIAGGPLDPGLVRRYVEFALRKTLFREPGGRTMNVTRRDLLASLGTLAASAA